MKWVAGFAGEEVDAFDPADGAGDLADEAVAGVGAAGDEAGVDVGGDGDDGVVEGDGFEVGGEEVLRGLHEGAVEGGADVEHDGLFGSGLFAEIGCALDGGFGGPEMATWAGELRLAGETTARLGLKVLASGV